MNLLPLSFKRKKLSYQLALEITREPLEYEIFYPDRDDVGELRRVMNMVLLHTLYSIDGAEHFRHILVTMASQSLAAHQYYRGTRKANQRLSISNYTDIGVVTNYFMNHALNVHVEDINKDCHQQKGKALRELTALRAPKILYHSPCAILLLAQMFKVSEGAS